MDEITLRAIENFNEHWKNGKVAERLKENIKREKFYKILKYLDERQIISIMGLRRTGKTTIIFQIADYLIEKGVNPKDIFYFSFDEITAKNPEIIEEIIQHFLINVSKSGLNEKEKKYFLFDEIQKIEDWQAIIKRYYDLKYNIKFIVSGSESLAMKKSIKESLAGRTFDFLLTPLSFKEFLMFKGFEIKETNYKKIYAELLSKQTKISSLFEDFLLKGGFPETLNLDIEKAQEYINDSVIQKIIFKDIPIHFKITNPEILIKILELASKNTSQLFEIMQISEVFNIGRNSASLYISYLESSFLIHLSYNYTQSKVKQLRTQKKIFISDTGIANSILKQRKIDSPEYLGKLVETQIHNELSNNYETLFWRDKQQHEVDVIVKKNKINPIEIKYKTSLNSSDNKGIDFFLKKFRSNAIIVTKNIFKEENKIKYIPAWLFLLAYEGIIE